MPITADNVEISGNSFTLTLPENAGYGTRIASFGHTDSGATLRLSITGGNPNNRFSINGNNELVHNRAGLDFEDDDLDDFSLTISYVSNTRTTGLSLRWQGMRPLYRSPMWTKNRRKSSLRP